MLPRQVKYFSNVAQVKKVCPRRSSPLEKTLGVSNDQHLCIDSLARGRLAGLYLRILTGNLLVGSTDHQTRPWISSEQTRNLVTELRWETVATARNSRTAVSRLMEARQNSRAS